MHKPILSFVLFPLLMTVLSVNSFANGSTNGYAEQKRPVYSSQHNNNNVLKVGVIKPRKFQLIELLNESNLITDGFLPPALGRELSKTRLGAVLGDRRAQALLGDLYFDGIHAQKDLNLAHAWYRYAADHGSTYAQMMLSVIYQYGLGVTHDARIASLWYQRTKGASDRTLAQRRVAEHYLIRASHFYNPEQAIRWYKRSARANDVLAQERLGDFYARGRFVAQNDSVALKWYASAAKQNSPYGQYRLGLLFEQGAGVRQDMPSALRLIQRAALQGMGAAQYHLGHLYATGNGVDRNMIHAYAWIKVAQINTGMGDLNSVLDNELKNMEQQMSPVQLQQATDLHYELQSAFARRL